MTFTRVDEWAGFLTQEMYDRELESTYAVDKSGQRKIKDKRKHAKYTSMDLSTLAKSVDDIWVIDEHPNIRINYCKCIPKSAHMFADEEERRDAESFSINRLAFQNKLDQMCQYLSYFTEFYDEEKELMALYMNLKKVIDGGTNSLTVVEYKKHLFGKIFRDYNIKANIYRMVNANHYIDATVDEKTGRVFDAPDDFTNDDVKRLLAISMMLKIIIPPTEHYIATNTLYSKDDPSVNKLVLEIFIECFFKIGDQFDEYEADDLQEKLYIFAEKKVNKHYKGNKKLWEQQGALRGTTENSQLDRLLVKFLLADNFFKFEFNNTLSAFLKAIIETQLKYTVERVTYNYNPIHIDSKKDANGLSSKDKLEQSQMKVDETGTIRSAKALEYVLNHLEEKYGAISDDEINFYMKYLFHMDKFHNDILNYNFVKFFGGFTELKGASIRQVMEFVIYAKRELSHKGYKQLQWFISSLLKGKLSNRLLQNNRYINKFKSSSTYKHLVEDDYVIMIEGFKDDPILKIISRILNNQYSFVEYEQPELTGEPIEFNEDIISDEVLNFIDNI